MGLVRHRPVDPATGWIALPRPSAPRWWLPRGRATLGSLAIYHPVTAGGRVGWQLARCLARLGGQWLVPPGGEPLGAVREMVAPDIPVGGQLAVMRANHSERYVVLLMDAAGRPITVAKVALSELGRLALDREAAALTDFPSLQAPVSMPRLVTHRPGVLVTAAVPWRIRQYPWLLPTSVAASLGAFFRSTRTGSSQPKGAAHGDFAPWNLLQTRTGWTLVDWEAAEHNAAPFTDIFHFVVQAHALLKRPRQKTVLAGLAGRGWFGHAIRTYSQAADLPTDSAPSYFRQYLAASISKLRPDASDGRAGRQARQRLIDALSRSASG